MNSNFRIFVLAGISVLAPLSVWADFVTLKTGEKIECKIISETADSMQVEYHITPKIKDTKTILKSAIADVVRQTPAELEFKERDLAKLLPTGDLMSAREYETIIQDKLRTFIAKNPDTPEAREAEKMIAELAEEKSRVLSGQLKVEGKWIDAATAKRDSYNIEAYRLRLQMNAKAASRSEMRYLNALREFDKLRTNYGASPHFVLTIKDALDILDKFETQLNAMIAEAPLLIQKRQSGLKMLTGNDLSITMQAIAKEEAGFKTANEQQTREKIKWMDFYKYDVKSLQDVLVTVQKERTELRALDLAALQLENDTLTSMIRYLADGNLAEARGIYDRVSKAPALINKTIVQNMGKQLDDLEKAAQIEKANAAKTAATTPPPDQSNVTAPSNPVAEEMKKLQENKEKEAAEKAKKDAEAAAAKVAAEKLAALPPVEEASSIMDTIKDSAPLIIGVLLALGGLVWFMKKKKK